MTHYEFIKKYKPPLPCTPSYMTFGGKCMNCGYNPSVVVKQRGWTGKKCNTCKGTGQAMQVYFERGCQDCAGTGEEYV